MGEGRKHRYYGNQMAYDEDSDHELIDPNSFSSDSEDDSADVTTSPPLNSCNGPLFELSSLMEHLPPNKKGLSKHYQGKSQSFTSLADVQCLEDLPKKQNQYTRKIQPCMSYAGGLDATDNSDHAQSPRMNTMSKKASRVASCASMISSGSSSFLCSNKPPLFPVQKSMS